MSPCCAYRTSILKLHSSGKLLTVRNKMKLYTLKQMHRYIYRDNCLYRRNMDNIDIISPSKNVILSMNKELINVVEETMPQQRS